jgi:hypothetical protein
MKVSPPQLTTWTNYLVAAVLVLAPFHAFLTVWIGSTYDIYSAVRLWNEYLLLVLVILGGLLLWANKDLRRTVVHLPLAWLIGAYAGLHLILATFAVTASEVTLRAAGYGLIVNLRFLLLFALCGLAGAASPWLADHWRKLLLIPATLVILFGLLQAFVLPSNFLTHFGYGANTIPAYQAVDQKEAYARVQSTMRGPNTLGAYLVIILAAVITLLLRGRLTRRTGWIVGLLAAGTVIVLGYSYSRGAYVAAFLAVGSAAWLLIKREQIRRSILIGTVGLAVMSGLVIFSLRNNDTVQNIVFHTDEHSLAATSSGQGHLVALEQGFNDLKHEPLGRGPGTAGPASVYNNGQVRIAENYYMQLAQEVGWLGLILFVAIVTLVAVELWKFRTWPLATVLLASLIGLSALNLLSHAWTDVTLGLVWWGLGGIAVGTKGWSTARQKSK